MKTKQRKELIGNRTANSSLFENEDHSFTKEIYLDAVHYQDEDGSWKEMDDTFQENDTEETETAEEAAASASEKKSNEKEYVNKKGRWKVRLKKQSKEQGFVTMEKTAAALPGHRKEPKRSGQWSKAGKYAILEF